MNSDLESEDKFGFLDIDLVGKHTKFDQFRHRQWNIAEVSEVTRISMTLNGLELENYKSDQLGDTTKRFLTPKFL